MNVMLEGHTDSVGNPAENKKLSVERAMAIKTELQIDRIGANRVSTAGFGEEKPVESNETEEGRAKKIAGWNWSSLKNRTKAQSFHGLNLDLRLCVSERAFRPLAERPEGLGHSVESLAG